MKKIYTMRIEAWDKLYYPDETIQFITGALAFITAVWLVGLIATYLLSRNYDTPNYFSWYLNTELNKWTLRIWFAVGMITVGVWCIK